MRKILFVILILSSYLVHGSTRPDSLYNQAVEAYGGGKFEKSLELYKELLGQDLQSADLYYNMGNAAFRSNKLGYAILYYEKALKLDPGHAEAKSNLDYVSLYKEDQLESVPEFFLKIWFHKLFKTFSLELWSTISLILFIFILLGILLYIFGQRLPIKKTGFAVGIVSLVVFILSFSATLKRHREIVQPDKAVIIDPSVVVKSSPSMSGTDLFILHEGTRVVTDETVSEWTEIRISDGRIGWVPMGALESI